MDIPGYKWDRTRKRYFKVLKTGEMPNSDYTVSALANNDLKSKRTLVRREKADVRQEECVVQSQSVLRLGNRSRIYYSGRSTEMISSFAVTPNGPLIGARDGTLAMGGRWKSDPGRSIVDICVARGKGVVAAVDNEAGTFVGYGTESLHVKMQFVTQLLEIGSESELSIGFGSQRGLNVWRPGVGSVDVIRTGSLSALSRGDGPIITVGTRNGDLKLIDLRSPLVVTAGCLGNGKMITHVASLPKRHAILATGLEDQMMLFDTRKAVEPIYQFQGYENWSTSSHGFALSPDSETAAVAMDTGVVEVFDVFSGDMSKTLYQNNKTSSTDTKRTATSVVTCIHWTEDGLLMASGNKLRAFPSTMQIRESEASQTLVHELEVTHSNINLHEKS